MFFRRVVGLLALLFGVVGVAACAAGAYGAWRLQTRLDRANDQAFDAVDRGLGEVQDRVPVVKERVRKSKLTSDELSAAVREWAANDAKDRVVAALQIEARTAALAGNLQAADARLDASAMAMGDIRRLLDLAQSLGGQVDPTSTDQVLELIAALRGQLNEAEQAVEEVRRFANPDGGTIEQRVAQIAKLLARVVLTLSEFEARLDEFATRLTEIRGEARQLQEQTSNYILLGAIVCYALLAWIAAGQAALCWWGVMRCRRRTAAIL